MSFLNKLGKELIVFDGGLGTLIQSEVKILGIPDELNIVRPDLIKKFHRMYVEADADVITTNTFGANEFKLKKSKYTVEDIVISGVKNANAVSGTRWVALDIGPTGQMIEPYGKLTFEDAYDAFKRQIIAGSQAGCDLVLIETMSDICEAKAAVLATKENTDLPIICTMTFDKNGKTYTGVDPVTMVAVLEGLGVDALGVNCSVGPKDLLPIVEKISRYSSTPILIQPNAGMPISNGGETYYDVAIEDFAQQIKTMVDLGVEAVGGCCGTNPVSYTHLRRRRC